MKTSFSFHFAGLYLATITAGLGQPCTITINNQPQSQANCIGTTVTTSVTANGTPPLSYQWQRSGDQVSWVNVPDATNNTIVITNFQNADVAYYRVVVTNSECSVASQAALLSPLYPPGFTSNGQPTNWPSVSLGASVTNRLLPSGSPPQSYQWRFNTVPLPGQTKTTIILTNVQLANAGDYDVVLSNTCGSIISRVIKLNVDPTFTKITTGPIVTDLEGSHSGVWDDYDKDGFPDLFVANNWANNRNTLYHNNGGTNFARVNAAPFTTDYLQAWSAAWGDYDNDGWDDLVVGCLQGGTLAQRLYRNNGGQSFSPVLDQGLLSDTAQACYLIWLDYDRDGFLDLFVSKGIYSGSPANDCLFRNQRDGTFKRMTSAEVGPIVADQSRSDMTSAADYDRDGLPELSVVHLFPVGGGEYNSAVARWNSQADGTFVAHSLGLPESVGNTWWADYDNDGFMDVLGTGSLWDQAPGLYRNLSGGGFSNVTASLNMIRPALVSGGGWGDYDNDGWLDLICVEYGGATTLSNLLFHANGDGTFTQVLIGSPVYDGSRTTFPSWADYNNDGFLDLFIAAGDVLLRNNLLYRNNGNGNHWLKVKLDGRASNRSGIGARVRAQATINGKTFWQLRAIGYGAASVGPNSLIAHFGLGDAAKVTRLRIEWPSGIVQELQNVAANTNLTIVESQSYTNTNAIPKFTGAVKTTGGVELSFSEPATNAVYILEASTDLVTWTKLMAKTSTGAAAAQFIDSRSTNYTRRFYRLQVP